MIHAGRVDVVQDVQLELNSLPTMHAERGQNSEAWLEFVKRIGKFRDAEESISSCVYDGACR